MPPSTSVGTRFPRVLLSYGVVESFSQKSGPLPPEEDASGTLTTKTRRWQFVETDAPGGASGGFQARLRRKDTGLLYREISRGEGAQEQ